MTQEIEDLSQASMQKSADGLAQLANGKMELKQMNALSREISQLNQQVTEKRKQRNKLVAELKKPPF